MVKKGKITAAQFLDKFRHHGMDEVAQSTNNRHERSLKKRKEIGTFNSTITCAHERDKFSTTVALCSCADGTMSQPMLVIHSQASENTITAEVYSGFENNRSINVATSKSSYNTQSIFFQMIVDLQKKTGACKGNPIFYWMDNHESHWNGKAIGYVILITLMN